MDSNSRVVQNQVQENDEHHPSNVDSQQVAQSEEKQQHDNEGKSVFNRVKAKAKKIKDTIKKHGHNVFDHGHEDQNEDNQIPDDHDLDKYEDQQVHEVPIHETEAVRSAAPTSEKVENLGKSEVNFEGTKAEGEETHHKPRVVDVSPTTEIDQNITTGQGKTFVGEEKSEQPKVNLERPIGLEEDPPKYNQTEVTDLTGTGTAEIDIAQVEKSFERMNVQDEQENVTETKWPPAGTGSHNQFVPDLYTANKTQDHSSRSATPTSEQVENLKKSGVNFGGTTGLREEPHHEPRVVDVSPTTEINQNITTDQAKTFVYEEKSEQPNVYSEEDSHGSGSRAESYTPPKYHQTEVADLTGEGTAEIDIAPVEKSFERMNVQDEQEYVTETKSPPAGTGSLNQFEPDLYTANKTQDHSSRSATPTSEINQNITTDQAKTFGYEEKSEQPNVYLEEDSHGSGSRAESYTPPKYHQTEVTDLTGAGTEEIGITNVEKSFERVNVQDDLKHSPELKVLPSVTDTQYPPAATGSHNQFVPEISTPTKTENLSAESHDQYTPELSSAPKIQYPSAEVHHQFVPEFSTAAKTQYPSDGSHDQFDPETISTSTNRDHEISEATEQTFNNNTTTKVEEQPNYESVENPSNVSKYTDKSGDASNKSGSTAEYGKNNAQSLTEKLGPEPVYGEVAEVGSAVKSKVSGTGTGAETETGTETENEVKEEKKGVSSVKDYLADKLRPGEEDKALSEVISETLHKPKKDSEDEDEKPEKVSEESSVHSPEKGVVDKFKGYVGSWFGTPGENQSTQGDEGLSKSDNSGVEVEQVKKAEG